MYWWRPSAPARLPNHFHSSPTQRSHSQTPPLPIDNTGYYRPYLPLAFRPSPLDGASRISVQSRCLQRCYGLQCIIPSKLFPFSFSALAPSTLPISISTPRLPPTLSSSSSSSDPYFDCLSPVIYHLVWITN